MAGHTYVTNGYSNYPNLPPEEGGYVYGPNHEVNWYTVETTTVERFHVPSNGYNNIGSSVPLKNDYRREYMPNYSPKAHREIYELNYGPDDENANPPRYHERENLMNNFINKLQIEASRPTKIGYLSGPNKYQPTNPNKYGSKSPTYGYPSREPHFIQTQYLPASNRYRPISPNKYRPTSPDKYRPISPIKYSPTSPPKYHTTIPRNYHQTSPPKYHTTIPRNYHQTSPTKYRPTSPTKYRPISPPKYPPVSPTKYHETSSPKYQPPSMNKFQETNPTKHQPSSPTHNYPSKEAHLATEQNFSDPNKNQLTSPIHNVPSREIQPTRTQNISDPNNFNPLSQGPDENRNTTNNFLGPNNQWQSTNPPVAHKPLSSPTNDINEALGLLAESVNNSPRAQPVKPEKRFGWNALGATTRRFMRSDPIDSQEAVKKYNGAHVP